MTNPTREQLQHDLERAGTALSNAAYNIAQRPSSDVTKDDRATLDNMRRAWDLALGRWRQVNHLTGSQAPTGCTCGQPRAENMMHRTSGPCLPNAAMAGMERAGEILHLDRHQTSGAPFFTIEPGKPAAQVAGAEVVHKLAKWITQHPSSLNKDHACSRCHPFSDLLKDGFVCAFHTAVDIMSHPAPEPDATKVVSVPDDVAKDAARWEFLRTQHESDKANAFCVFKDDADTESLDAVGSMPGELDATIDAALAADRERT